MIVYDSSKGFFHIATKNTSYIIRLKCGFILEHLYYGKRLQNISGKELFPDDEIKGFSAVDCESDADFSRLSTESIMQEYAFFGSADLRKPSFYAQYKDDSRITKMKYTEHKIYDGKNALCGLPSTYAENNDSVQTLEITLLDEITGLYIF